MYFFRYLTKVFAFVTNCVLHKLECAYLAKAKIEFEYRPIFVIGPPRSGSTLITQVITDAFDFGYITNVHCRFFGSPVLVEKVLHPLRRKMPSRFHSVGGNTGERYGPAECGNFWYRFFPRVTDRTATGRISAKRMNCLCKSIAALSKEQNKPVLFKNLFNTLRVTSITNYIPEVLFILVKRNEIDNGHSILQCRMRFHGNYTTWWSVPPPGVEKLQQLPPEEQVIEQIRGLHSMVSGYVADGVLDARRLLVIDYDQFCCNVYGELERLESFFDKNEMNVRRLFEVPPTFARSKDINIPAEMYERMVIYSGRENLNRPQK